MQTVSPPRQPVRLFNRNLLLLGQGQFVSRLGAQIVLIGLVLWVKQVSDSAALVGLAQMAAVLPAALLGPFGGIGAQRWRRRRVILLSDAIRGLTILSLAALIFFVPGAAGLAMGWLFVVLLLNGILGAFFEPALSAAVPDLVPADHVPSAHSLGQLSYQLAMLLGQGTGGTLFRLFGAPVLFLVDGLSYLFAAASEAFVSIPHEAPPGEPEARLSWREQADPFLEDFKLGLSYIWRRQGLREVMFVSAFLSFFSMAVVGLLPFYVEDVLQAPPDWYGFVLATTGIGALFGTLMAGSIRLTGSRRIRWIIVLVLVQAVGYGALGLVTNRGIALVFALLGGAAGGFIAVYLNSAVQITTSPRVRGQVLTVLGAISGVLASLAMGLAGIIAELLNQNIPPLFIACGVAMAVSALITTMMPNFRYFMRRTDADARVPTVDERVVPLAGMGMLGRSTLSEGVRTSLSSETLAHVLIAGTLGMVLGTVAIVVSPVWALAIVGALLAAVFFIMG